jgi:hypothetical protein
MITADPPNFAQVFEFAWNSEAEGGGGEPPQVLIFVARPLTSALLTLIHLQIKEYFLDLLVI